MAKPDDDAEPPDLDPKDNTDPPEEDDKDPDGAADLGEGGKKALAAMKAEKREEIRKRKAAESELAQLKAAAAKKPDDPPPDAEQIRKEAAAEVRAELAKERALDRVEVLAAKKFANPTDARHFLTAHVDEFLDGTTVDVKAVTEALDDLLEAKPYLAAKETPRFQGGGDNGPRGNGKPKDLDTEIAEANSAGDWRRVLRLQNQKLGATKKPT
jgi:hypothetical protein